MDKNYEQRLAEWSEFRTTLESSDDPIQDTINYYKLFPQVSIHTDPYDKTTWPTPWELIHENQYCEYCILLGICYTLQLTDRFKGSKFEIHIGINKERSKTLYLLFVDDKVIGYNSETYVHMDDVKDDFFPQHRYTMEPIQ